MVITKGQIGNALTSVATDHVVAVTNDIYDEAIGRYQSDLNGRYYSMPIAIALGMSTSHNDDGRLILNVPYSHANNNGTRSIELPIASSEGDGVLSKEDYAKFSEASLEEWQTDLLNNLYGGGVVKSLGNPIAYQETVSIPYNFTQYGENSVHTVAIPRVTTQKAGVLSNYDYRGLMEGLTKVTENIEPWIQAIQRTGFVSDIDTEATKNALNVKVFITNDTIEGSGVWKSVSIPINSKTQACLISGTYYDWLSKLNYELSFESSIIRDINITNTADSLAINYQYIQELGEIGDSATYGTIKVNVPIVSDTNAGVLSAAQYNDFTSDINTAKTDISACEAAIEDLDNTKAATEDLSNILGEEVIDNPLELTAKRFKLKERGTNTAVYPITSSQNVINSVYVTDDVYSITSSSTINLVDYPDNNTSEYTLALPETDATEGTIIHLLLNISENLNDVYVSPPISSNSYQYKFSNPLPTGEHSGCFHLSGREVGHFICILINNTWYITKISVMPEGLTSSVSE